MITHPHCFKAILKYKTTDHFNHKDTLNITNTIYNYLAVYFSFSEQILQGTMQKALNTQRNLRILMFLWELCNSNWDAKTSSRPWKALKYVSQN